MVSVVASNADDRICACLGRVILIKDYKIDTCCFSDRYTVLRTKIGLIGIRIICPSGLHVVCC